MVTVYGLIDPIDQELRYVGQTNRPVAVRLTQHLRNAALGKSAHVGCWLKGLASQALLPEVVVLEESETKAAGDEAESFWIGYAKSIGCRLTNRSDGGGTNRGWKHSAEQREKWRTHRSGENAPWFGKKRDAETIRKMSEAARAQCAERGHGPMLGKTHSAETRQKIRENLAKNPPKFTKAGRAAQIAGLARLWEDPSHREMMRERMSGANNPRFGKRPPEHQIEAVRAAGKRRVGSKHSPETIAKLCAAAQRREERKRAARLSEAN